MRIDRTGMPTSAAARGFWLVARNALPIAVKPKKHRERQHDDDGRRDDRDVLLLQDHVADEDRRAGRERRQAAHLLGVGHDAHRALEQVGEPDGGDDHRHQIGLGVFEYRRPLTVSSVMRSNSAPTTNIATIAATNISG